MGDMFQGQGKTAAQGERPEAIKAEGMTWDQAKKEEDRKKMGSILQNIGAQDFYVTQNQPQVEQWMPNFRNKA